MSADDPITIGQATQEDIDWMDEYVGDGPAGYVEDGAITVRFYGKLVAILNEYGTATVLEGIDKDAIERLGNALHEVFPRRYRENGMRICYRCNYNEPNHAALTKRGKIGSGPDYIYGCCGEFVPVPEHLRF